PAAVDDEVEPLGEHRSTDLDEDVAHERQVLDDGAVAVDDRVVDPTANRRELRAGFVRHRGDYGALDVVLDAASTLRPFITAHLSCTVRASGISACGPALDRPGGPLRSFGPPD